MASSNSPPRAKGTVPLPYSSFLFISISSPLSSVQPANKHPEAKEQKNPFSTQFEQGQPAADTEANPSIAKENASPNPLRFVPNSLRTSPNALQASPNQVPASLSRVDRREGSDTYGGFLFSTSSSSISSHPHFPLSSVLFPSLIFHNQYCHPEIVKSE